jgi:PHD/YefM family antitoxin component YafN of YafNO toxin-antitoxin module
MKTKRPLRITRHKQPAAVLIDADEYERLNYEREFFAAIAKGRTAVAGGRVRPHAEVMGKMRHRV